MLDFTMAASQIAQAAQEAKCVEAMQQRGRQRRASDAFGSSAATLCAASHTAKGTAGGYGLEKGDGGGGGV